MPLAMLALTVFVFVWRCYFSGCLKGVLRCRCIDLRYPKIIFNFVSLVKNNFWRLLRLYSLMGLPRMLRILATTQA